MRPAAHKPASDAYRAFELAKVFAIQFVHLTFILGHHVVKCVFFPGLKLCILSACDDIDDDLFGNVSQNRVESNTTCDPVLIAVVVDSWIFSVERLQVELSGDAAVRGQEDAESVEDEEEDDADEERNVRPNGLSEGLGDAKRHARDEVLEVGDHEQDGLLVARIRRVPLQVRRV